MGAAGAMAAVLTAYVAAARPTPAYVLEQTISGDDSGVELTSFVTSSELLGPDSAAPESNHPILQETPLSSQDDLAG